MTDIYTEIRYNNRRVPGRFIIMVYEIEAEEQVAHSAWQQTHDPLGLFAKPLIQSTDVSEKKKKEKNSCPVELSCVKTDFTFFAVLLVKLPVTQMVRKPSLYRNSMLIGPRSNLAEILRLHYIYGKPR